MRKRNSNSTKCPSYEPARPQSQIERIRAMQTAGFCRGRNSRRSVVQQFGRPLVTAP
jgi:hypothetical protein